MNLSLSEGIFLDRWNRAIVKPLIRKTNLDTIFSNYRPINNLSFLSKILEKVVQLQLRNHIDEQKLLPDYQSTSSYRTNYSTETASDDIWRAMERQEVTSMVALDLNEAFDTVNHQILCDVLEKRFAVTENALQWTKSYLENRVFHVQVGKSMSAPVTINYSVHQGSILGPFLLVMQLHSMTLSGYADDHSLMDSFRPGDGNSERECSLY